MFHNSALESKIGIGGALRLRFSHSTVRTSPPYTAVRKIALTRAEQRRETERNALEQWSHGNTLPNSLADASKTPTQSR